MQEKRIRVQKKIGERAPMPTQRQVIAFPSAMPRHDGVVFKMALPVDGLAHTVIIGVDACSEENGVDSYLNFIRPNEEQRSIPLKLKKGQNKPFPGKTAIVKAGDIIELQVKPTPGMHPSEQIGPIWGSFVIES